MFPWVRSRGRPQWITSPGAAMEWLCPFGPRAALRRLQVAIPPPLAACASRRADSRVPFPSRTTMVGPWSTGAGEAKLRPRGGRGRYDLSLGMHRYWHPRLREGETHTARPRAGRSSPRWSTTSSSGASFRTRRAVPALVGYVDIDGTVAPTRPKERRHGTAPWPSVPWWPGGPSPWRRPAPVPHVCSRGGRGRRWPVR